MPHSSPEVVNMYCGDETGAFIGDVGSHTARFGYGGEDCPKVVVPSAAYHTPSHSSSTTAVNGSDDGRGINSSTSTGRRGRGKYSAPVSLMRMPPGGETFEDEDGFVPIYSSLNSNDTVNQQQNSNDVPNNNDGMIQDIDAWASLWEYSYSALCVRGRGKHTMGHKFHQSELPELQPEHEGPSQQTISSQSNFDGPIDHPLLAVDSTSRTNIIPSSVQEKQRAQMLEVLFESLSAPAAYIAPSAMLSSFAYGRQTALVVDVGHSGSRVTPLVDGYCLTNGSVSSERGGRWLGNVQQCVLEGGFKNVNNGTVVNKWNGWDDCSGSPPCRDGGVIPRYMLHSNTKKCSKNKLQLLKQSSFHSMAVHEVMYEMMSSSHIVPLENSKEESPPFCGYGEDGESMVIENDNNNDTVMEEDDEDDDNEGPCYILPDGTRVDLAKSKAGKDLCRLPVSVLTLYIMLTPFSCPK